MQFRSTCLEGALLSDIHTCLNKRIRILCLTMSQAKGTAGRGILHSDFPAQFRDSGITYISADDLVY